MSINYVFLFQSYFLIDLKAYIESLYKILCFLIRSLGKNIEHVLWSIINLLFLILSNKVIIFSGFITWFFKIFFSLINFIAFFFHL